MKRTRAITATLVLLGGLPALAHADDVSVVAGSGRSALRTASANGSETWRYTTPTAADTITWISGTNWADTTAFRHAPFTEPKFGFPGATGRRLVGLTFSDGPGVWGSRAATSGSGNSRAVPGTWGTNHVATWVVAATGSLGNAPRAFWQARMRGFDPFNITPENLVEAGVTEAEYDIFVTAGLDAGTTMSSTGEMRLDVFYETAEGAVNLLTLAADPDGVTAGNDDPPDLRFYLLDALDEGPTENASNLITLEELRELLESDLLDGGIDAPLYVGIVWEDVPVPTVAMPGGSLAKLRIESSAADAGAALGGGCGSLMPPWIENFDSYIPGQGIIGQCGWTGFNNNPGFDGIVNPFIAFSPPHSLDVQGSANLVRDFAGTDQGVWTFSTMQLIPPNFQSGGGQPQDGSYVVIFDDYQPNNFQHPAVVLQFDSNDGMLKALHGNGNQTVNLPYIVDQWVPIDVVVDLENDHTAVFYNQQLLTEYQWTAGAFGDGQGQPQISAVNLFARGSSSIFYDDMVFEPLAPPQCDGADANCDGVIDAFDIEPFIGLLVGSGRPCAPCSGDINGDGAIDAFDIEPFIQRLTMP